ncbi:MAG: TonB-dependent receptor domain-containing protein, partial [Candidatus Binatia bacterium]
LLGKASVGGPIIRDFLKATASFVGENRDGWLTNLTTGETLEGRELYSGRAAVDVEPLEWLTLSVTGDLSHQEDDGPQPRYVRPAVGNFVSDSAASPLFRPYDTIIGSIEDQFAIVLDPIRDRVLAEIAGGRASTDPREVYTDFPPHTEIESEGVSATVTASLGPVDAKLIGGWRSSERKHNFDADGSDQPLIHMESFDDRGEQTSLELHFSTEGELPFGLGRGRGLAGAYFYDEKAHQFIDIALLTLAPNELAPLAALIPPDVPLLQNRGLFTLNYDADLDVRSYAGFGEGEWDVFEWLTLRAGGRYTIDEKTAVLASLTPIVTDGCMPTRHEETFSAFTGKLGADVPIDDDRMVYATFSQGF